MDLAGFDASMQEEWRPSGGVIPDCEVLAVIDQSEEKTNKKGTGSYLELRFEVIEGPSNGRKLWVRLNLNNPSEKAVQIARAELGAICKAVGVITPNVNEDLHDRPLRIKIRSEADQNGVLRNVIKGYKPEKEEAPKAESAPSKVIVPASAQKPKAPWEKKPQGWGKKEATPF